VKSSRREHRPRANRQAFFFFFSPFCFLVLFDHHSPPNQLCSSIPRSRPSLGNCLICDSRAPDVHAPIYIYRITRRKKKEAFLRSLRQAGPCEADAEQQHRRVRCDLPFPLRRTGQPPPTSSAFAANPFISRAFRGDMSGTLRSDSA
jgi:hypothetical protein